MRSISGDFKPLILSVSECNGALTVFYFLFLSSGYYNADYRRSGLKRAMERGVSNFTSPLV